MNLRQKNKKLKYELESARCQLAFDKEFIEQARRTVTEAKNYINKNIGDITTLRLCAHSPGYALLSEEEFKVQIVKRMIPELAKCVTLEHYMPRGGVPNAEFTVAEIRVVKLRE